MAYPRAMTPDMEVQARVMAAAQVCRLHIARALGVMPLTVSRWAKREGVTLADGRRGRTLPSFRATDAFKEAARKNQAKATAAAAAKKRLPLTDDEWRTYRKIRREGGARDETLRAIGRADLAEATK